MLLTASHDSIQKSTWGGTRVEHGRQFVHWIKSQDNADFLFRKSHKQLRYDAWTEKLYAWSCLVQLSVRGLCQAWKAMWRTTSWAQLAARKQDEMYLIIMKNIPVEGRKRKFWLIFFGKKDPWFYWCWAENAELKNQVIGLQLATEIELYPEISVITRYWNIK